LPSLADNGFEVLRKTHHPFGDWREVPGYSGMWASSDGRIWSARKAGVKAQHVKGGYARVYIWLKSRDRSVSVHRLIALAFHGAPPSDRHSVDHINRDKLDNRAANLRWACPVVQARNRDDFVPASRRARQVRAQLQLLLADEGTASALGPAARDLAERLLTELAVDE
jgi:hypothetical protein